MTLMSMTGFGRARAELSNRFGVSVVVRSVNHRYLDIQVRTNLRFFETLAPELSRRKIETVRISFAQWYRKAKRRAAAHGLDYLDPEPGEKLEQARYLAGIAATHGLRLFACSQDFVTAVPGIESSACIDGRLLQELHPDGAAVSVRKDKTQRKECRCTESIDIGSYTQHCPQACLYCYANPSL